MRLDHLLSKEPLRCDALLNSQQMIERQKPFRMHTSSGGAHGWNTDNQLLFITAGPAGGSNCYIDALLGPERTRECFFHGKTYAGFRFLADRITSVVVMVWIFGGSVCVV